MVRLVGLQKAKVSERPCCTLNPKPGLNPKYLNPDPTGLFGVLFLFRVLGFRV